jgi:hypothetical protein
MEKQFQNGVSFAKIYILVGHFQPDGIKYGGDISGTYF